MSPWSAVGRCVPALPPSRLPVCMVTCSSQYCRAAAGLSKPRGQGMPLVLSIALLGKQCTAQLLSSSMRDQIQDCQNWTGIVTPLSSWEQKNLWQGTKNVHPMRHAKPHAWCWQYTSSHSTPLQAGQVSGQHSCVLANPVGLSVSADPFLHPAELFIAAQLQQHAGHQPSY